MSRRLLDIAVWLVRGLVGVVFVGFFLRTATPSLRALLLVFVTASLWNVVSPVFDIDRRAQAYFPGYLRAAVRQGLSMTAGVGYYLLLGNSVVGKVLCIGLLAVSLRYFVVAGLLLAAGLSLVRRLGTTDNATSSRGASPFILISIDYTPRMAQSFASFVVGLGLATWRSRSPTMVKGIRADLLDERMYASEARSGRSVAGFIGTLLGFFIAPRSLVAFVDSRGLESCDEITRESARRLAIAHVSIPGLGSNLLRLLLQPERVQLQSLISTTSIHRDLQVARTKPDEDRLHEGHSTPGQCFILMLIPSALPVGETPDSSERVLEGYELIQQSQVHLRMAPRMIAQGLRAAALPLSRSDAELPIALRSLVFDIGQIGLAPLADAYLRFRLSVSDVERFVVLLECFEVLFKYSVVLLLRGGPEARPGIAAKLLGPRPPTMGTWTTALSELATPSKYADRSALASVAAAWRSGRPCSAAVDVVGAANKFVGSLDSVAPISNLAWLEWLRLLRNATRGHGGLREKAAGMLWHGLHHTFLELVSDLAVLTLRAQLATAGSDGQSVYFRGWRRGPYRTSTLTLSPMELPAETTDVYLHVRDLVVPLAPFTILKMNECWTWNGASSRERTAEYVEYGSGNVAPFATEY